MRHKQKKHSGQLHKNWICSTVIAGVLIIITFVASIFLAVRAVQEGAATAYDAFKTAEQQVEHDIYNEFYERSKQSAEENYHVSHRAAITIGDIREESNLQVLNVSAVGYSIQEQSDNGAATAWLKVTGTGTFTVNLQASEFLIDDERQYVLARIPKPDLTSFDTDAAEPLLYKDGSWGPFNGDNSVGTALAQKQVQEATLDARESITSNQRFYESAKASAKFMVENLIQALNQDVKDLIVEIEFME